MQRSIRALAFSSLVMMSCGYNASEVRSYSVPTNFGIRITPEATAFKLQISAPSDVTSVYLCMNVAKDACTSATALATYAAKDGSVATSTQNKIFQYPTAIAIQHLATSITIGDIENKYPKRHAIFVDPTKEGSIDSSLSLITEESMRKELMFFASPEFKGRDTGSPENVKAADYVIEELKKMGIKAANPDGNYRQHFTVSNSGLQSNETANVIGLIEGNDPVLKDRYIVIGAHMDHVGSRACIGGGMCQGADDNGSGTVSVLHIARGLAAMKSTLKRSVLVMWYSGEELGLLGSKHYVRSPIIPLDKTDYMINLDMVGYLRSGRLELGGGARSPVGKALVEKTLAKYPSIRPKVTAEYGNDSDHASFFNKGIAGTFFHTGLHDVYHKKGDVPQAPSFNYAGMADVAKIALEHMVDVVNTPDQFKKVTSALKYVDPSMSIHGLDSHAHEAPNFPSLENYTGCAHELNW